MEVTWHWVQRVGAQAVAALTGADHPHQVGAAHLDQVVRTITADAGRAARAARRGPGYAWWLALNAAYPNSPATHPARGGWPQDRLQERLVGLFAPDEPDPVGECWTCQRPAGARWGKSLWPLAAATTEVNAVPRGPGGRVEGGVPVCRSCRIAAWALPYASVHNGATLTTYELWEDEAAMGVARLVVAHNQKVITGEEASWPHPRTPAGLEDLLGGQEHIRHVWRNDNRSPVVESTYVPVRALVRWPDQEAVPMVRASGGGR